MKTKRIEEDEIISLFRKAFKPTTPDVVLGIGDDAALVKAGNKQFVITKDLLIEGTHFQLSFHPADLLGKKSLNVSLSDIAAMGGLPRFALLGLGLPKNILMDWVGKFMKGLKAAAHEYDISIIGGDVVRAAKATISITLTGEADSWIKRGGAAPGDLLFVSGTLGDAKQGLLLLKKGRKPGDDPQQERFLRAFLDPVPRVKLGYCLNESGCASSMIDISDGLSVDLNRLCKESGCGAEIEADKVPVSSELRALQRRASAFAVHGGEDYELLFTVPPSKMKDLSRIQKRYKLTCIGRMTKGRGVFLVDKKGTRKKLRSKGYKHFASS